MNSITQKTPRTNRKSAQNNWTPTNQMLQPTPWNIWQSVLSCQLARSRHPGELGPLEVAAWAAVESLSHLADNRWWPSSGNQLWTILALGKQSAPPPRCTTRASPAESSIVCFFVRVCAVHITFREREKCYRQGSASASECGVLAAAHAGGTMPGGAGHRPCTIRRGSGLSDWWSTVGTSAILSQIMQAANIYTSKRESERETEKYEYVLSLWN